MGKKLVAHAEIRCGKWRFRKEEEIDQALRECARRGFQAWLEVAELVALADELQRWAKTGYRDLEHYLREHCSLSYRSVRRYLVIQAALETLPEGQRALGRSALLEMGSHKAEAVSQLILDRVETEAPLDPSDLAEWRDLAAETTEDAFQEAVSRERGVKPRGRDSNPGDRFKDYVLNQLPPALRGWMEELFRRGMAHYELTNPVAFFIVMGDSMARDLGDQGVEVPPRP